MSAIPTELNDQDASAPVVAVPRVQGRSGVRRAIAEERDACGIGFVARSDGEASREVVELALAGLAGVKHRGAVAADAVSGDGAGILTQIPRDIVAEWARASTDADGDVPLDRSRLGLAFLFLAPGTTAAAGHERAQARSHLEAAARDVDIEVVAWRDVPIDRSVLGDMAADAQPFLTQAVLYRPEGGHHAGTDSADAERVDGERQAHRLRRLAAARCRAAGLRFYAASCSFVTVTYKAMVASDRLAGFYPDLRRDDWVSSLAVFHSRFSTNTAPSWERAQPFRMSCHNGEINTVGGNTTMMRARHGDLVPGALSIDGTDWARPADLLPLLDEDQSDSARLDETLDVLVRGGRDVRHAMAMMVPQVWEGARDLAPGVRDFYRYHATLMEPWDGPAGLIFTDGVRVGASLDRNGLRPLRYHVYDDGLVVAASEVGAVPSPASLAGTGDLQGSRVGVVRRARLGPGQMMCVDPAEGGLQEDVEVKAALADHAPYGTWIAEHLRSVPAGRPVDGAGPNLLARQHVYGFTREEVISVLRPMATEAKEAISSMGDDTPIEPMSQVRRPVSHYLKQRFAQVTNPPIDHYREHEVMSLRTQLGGRQPVLTQRPEAARLLELESFFMFPDGLRRLVLDPEIGLVVQALDATFPIAAGVGGLAAAVEQLATEAVEHARQGTGIIVVSDVGSDEDRCRVPILLAVGAVHQRLVAEGIRTRTSLVAETNEARETHDMASLLGFGADVIVPRLVLETIADLADEGRIGGDNPSASVAQERYRTAIEDGVLKIMAKMGISVLDAFRGAQTFEALGLSAEVVDRCLTGTVSTVGGLTFDDLGADLLAQHTEANEVSALASPGIIKWKQQGEFHDMNKPVIEALHDVLGLGRSPSTTPFVLDGLRADDIDGTTAALLRTALAEGRTELYQVFSDKVRSRPTAFLRDFLRTIPAGDPVPVADVEPVEAITRRFSTGAMSHGALSAEAHQTLAAALNLIGGRANSGEGGEDPARFMTRGERHDFDCRIKQVASGRFGVTPQYLANAQSLQIKMAQGSKPGEGGQIPGHKVTDEIARLRHTTAGVTLISPPPHHDIYSIEDLAQLIFDLKQVNPAVEVDVKLVAESGVGTVAAGVVKALADSIHISGNDGGTGASPLSSIQHAGMPWELGLAEVQQELRRHRLRGRVSLRVDGGFKTGHDVIAAALLGADEYAFGTAALFAEGCIMARACHRDTCPVGITTQRRDLRDKFVGTPEMVAAYLTMVAEEVRHLLAGLGLRSLDDAIGRVDLLEQRDDLEGRARRLDLSALIEDPQVGERRFIGHDPVQRPRSELGDLVYEDAAETVFLGGIVEYTHPITNADRTVGARLGGAVGLEFGEEPPAGIARMRFTGSAGQSFGAFITDGIELVLDGEANDYVAKGMGGGTVIVRPPADDAGEPVLVGNTVLYGATGGELFVAGRAGERFAVRNSGAVAVVEGVGDHACEYMTGGTVVILGPTGSNLGAGMSGGECFVVDETGDVLARVNRQLVEARRPDGRQLERMRGLVERHATVTGSSSAIRMLERWSYRPPRVWRIAPKTELERVASAHGSQAAAG
ncbi:MAG: glutamate synthase-related protein [Nitriliruptoraceae bacterium]